MAASLTVAAQRVQDALQGLGLSCQVVELPASMRSALEAALAIGCRVEQIAKSLVFRGLTSNRPILAMVWTPHAVFRLTPADLQRITGGRVVSFKT
jgi:prolyl-tRNA editing enzyme YbaK/EbsC (Cys-tRNA(Pro) deacylase)